MDQVVDHIVIVMDTDTVIQCMVTVVVILDILDDTAGLVSERGREKR